MINAKKCPSLGDDFDNAPLITKPNAGKASVIAEDGSIDDIVSGRNEGSSYIQTSARLRQLFKRRSSIANGKTYTDEILSAVHAGYSIVVSGPNGAGKTETYTKLRLEIGSMSGLLSREVVFELNATRTAKLSTSDRNIYSLKDFNQMILKAKEAFERDIIVILFIDEYAELQLEQLSALRYFHQILFFGDYAQGTSYYQPIFDFVRRAGGASFVLQDIWRTKCTALFDLISFIAYDGAYRAFPSPINFKQGYDVFKIAKCLDDPQVEAVALFCAAKFHAESGLGYSVTIVVDDKTAQDAIAILIEKNGRDLDRILTIKSSNNLRGHETEVIIVATGAIDRLGLPTDVLLERLIVILGRAKSRVEFVLPESGNVGAMNRKFSCIVQPILSYRFQIPVLERSIYHDFSLLLEGYGYIVSSLYDFIVISYLKERVMIKNSEKRSKAEEIAQHMGWRFIDLSIEVLNLSKEDLIADDRFSIFREKLAGVFER